MAKFVKPYDESPKAHTSSGYMYEKVYTQQYDKDGRPYLKEVGEKNIVEMVNSNKDNANYEKLIKKFQATGDISFLNGKQGFYADISDMPSNLIEAYNSIENAKTLFGTLPLEDRLSYDNSFTKFLADFGSDKFLKAVGLKEKVERKVDELKEVVTENAAE